MNGTSVLHAENVHKAIATHTGDLRILDGVDFAVAEGEAVAITGASGSGKSTLLGLLAGLDLPTEGSIRVEGVELTTLDEDSRARLRARRAGFVFQSFHLLEDLTAEENVALPLELFGHAAPLRQARDWLERLGLSDRRSHFPRQLSGGEQQRVALCRAFCPRPALLFADEPTANLDQETAEGVIESLFTLRRETGTSLVLVTHDPRLAARCDRSFHLDGGRLHDAVTH